VVRATVITVRASPTCLLSVTYLMLTIVFYVSFLRIPPE
jgi:hypothetical protein